MQEWVCPQEVEEVGSCVVIWCSWLNGIGTYTQLLIGLEEDQFQLIGRVSREWQKVKRKEEEVERSEHLGV